DLESFPVHWSPQTALADTDAATTPDAPQLFEDRKGNIMCGGFVQCGDVEAALDAADVTVEAQYTTSFVEHGYIEPEAGFAQVIDGRIHV
ncbi:MAG TPA: hypothetical protein DD939_15205, partial [Sulfitobacter pontiacus]|nr:hypothetical protein [Sulfitobacter pontiacus]